MLELENAKPFDFAALKQGIRKAEAAQDLAVMEESKTDILTDDFCEDRHINYHMVPPTEVWLSERFFWAPSVAEGKDVWESDLPKHLMRVDHNMFVCLNKIIFSHADENDYEAICEAIGVESCEIPDFEELLGVFWVYASSVIINLTTIEIGAENEAEEYKASGIHFDRDSFIAKEVMLTLLHELRHVGIDGNPFLPEELYPCGFAKEENVEAWARDTYETIFI